MLEYYMSSNKNHSVALPVLNQIENKQLYLKGYKLSSGTCKSLCEAFGVNLQILNGITLDENGLSDTDLSMIIEGLSKQMNVKSIIIKANDFGDKS